MKRRNGFVSNSSSSSFIVTKDIINFKPNDDILSCQHGYESINMPIKDAMQTIKKDVVDFNEKSEYAQKLELTSEVEGYIDDMVYAYQEQSESNVHYSSQEYDSCYKDDEFALSAIEKELILSCGKHYAEKIEEFVKEKSKTIVDKWHKREYAIIEYENNSRLESFFEQTVMPYLEENTKHIVKSISHH